MLSRGHQFAWLGIFAFLVVPFGLAQSAFSPLDETQAPPALVRSVRMVPDPDGAAVEITTTRPLTPEITMVENPVRLVVDLKRAILPAAKAIPVHHAEVTGIRANQFQNSPPVTRVVIDLTKPIGYTWDAAGNHLMIRLRAKPIQTPGSAVAGGATVVSPITTASANVTTARGGNSAGSVISAGSEVAVMRLPRGGEVRVCPGTTVSATYSQSGRDLMLGMSTGALETDYSLGPAADSILTPDFRILMAGPGDFHFAISADSRGNTCVRSLPGNSASVIVSELMGDKTYQVKPAEQALFHSGRLTNVSRTIPPDCGCPPGEPGLRMADSPSDFPGSGQSAGPHVSVADPGIPSLPPPQKGAVQITVDAPFVFRANDLPTTPPAPVKEIGELAMTYSLPPEPLEVTVLPPPPPLPKSRGFFGKVKGFFSGLFR